MISNNIVYLFFLFLIVLSKEILVFNEEILVLFAFIIFLVLSYNSISDIILNELNSRSLKIKEEFTFYKKTQEKVLSHLISYFGKQMLLSKQIGFIFSSLNNNIEFILSNSSILYRKLLILGIDEKLKKLMVNESKTIFSLQKRINFELLAYLISAYSKKSLKNRKKSFQSTVKTLYRLSVN